MRRGETALGETCSYMVRRQEEIFLGEGEKTPPTQESENQEQQEKREYIAIRALKDPRDITVLDPACGSGHFLLYCFDLLWHIYHEAYDDSTTTKNHKTGRTLKEDYPDRADFSKNVPGLILRYNLHGIDIDRRATQIATLALWLRAHRAFQELEMGRTDRPAITKSNIVCAEPMPGEEELLNEFTRSLHPPLLGQLVRHIFAKMKLAGEAGSLLRIAEELRGVIEEARKKWKTQPEGEQLWLLPSAAPAKPEQLELFDFTSIMSDSFWKEAEGRVLEALRDYAARAASEKSLNRRLFAEDAERGFAFVDLSRKRYDVVVMNPPFGEPAKGAKEYVNGTYPKSKADLACAFVERWLAACVRGGRLGAITTRTIFFLSTITDWRQDIILKKGRLHVFADFGGGVLDAMVETAAYCLEVI